MEPEKPVINIKDPNQFLFNMVSSCLLKDFRFYDSSEQRRDLIISALQIVADTDPEFILQLAYYLRNQLYIRTTTNFILAFAANHPKTSPFLKKYFAKSVLLPSDFLDVCQWTQMMHVLKQNNFDFEKLNELKVHDFRHKLRFNPLLKEALKEKFKSFTIYHLGKYCSEAKRKKILRDYQDILHPERLEKRKDKKKKKLEEKQKAEGKMEIEKDEKREEVKEEDEEVLDGGRGRGRGGRGRGRGRGKLGKFAAKKNKFMKKHYPAKEPKKKSMLDSAFITMKDVIRTTHMKSPQFVIRSVLGKRYPETEDAFHEAFKGEDVKFDPTLAKKRMKIETPKTWETELSSKGNKPEVWTKLIDSNQLPYMAMMRNLRNLLKAGLDDPRHAKIINRIKNKKAVESAKMFPFQYFSALNEIDQLKTKELVKIGDKLVEVDELPAEIEEEMKEDKGVVKAEKKPFKSHTVDTLIDDYKESIKKAIQIAIDKNLEEIKGHTLIFCDVSGSMRTPISGGKKYGSIVQCNEVALLLGLMIKSKCQNSSFYIFSSPGQHPDPYLKIDLVSNDILEDMKTLKEESRKLGGGTDFPFKCIREHIEKKIHVDNIVILSDMMISEGYTQIDTGKQSTSDCLNELKNKVNPSLKIFSIDLRGDAKVLNLSDEFNEQNYIRIFGMSDGVLKFISVKEKGTQVEEIKKFAAEIDAPVAVAQGE